MKQNKNSKSIISTETRIKIIFLNTNIKTSGVRNDVNALSSYPIIISSIMKYYLGNDGLMFEVCVHQNPIPVGTGTAQLINCIFAGVVWRANLELRLVIDILKLVSNDMGEKLGLNRPGAANLMSRILASIIAVASLILIPVS